MKDPLVQLSSPEGVLTSSEAHQSNQDAADMARLGKAQQFRRNFSFWSTVGFVSIYMATWEFAIVSMSTSFATAGFGGFFWTFMGCMLCYSSVVLSLAEMCSMSPTAGGQYHWVSEFAPAGWQKEASYASGWMSSLGWIASLAGGNYICGNLVQVCVNIVWPDYEVTAWQLFLIILALLLVTIVLNTLWSGVLPMLEVVSLVGHTLGFVVVVGILWGMCRPLNSGRHVFASFENGSGWSNYGMACLLTQVSIIWSMLGSDTIVHICKLLGNISLSLAMLHAKLTSLDSGGSQRCVPDRAEGYVVVVCWQLGHGCDYGHHHALLHRPSGLPRSRRTVFDAIIEHGKPKCRSFHDHHRVYSHFLWKHYGSRNDVSGNLGFCKGQRFPFLNMDRSREFPQTNRGIYMLNLLFTNTSQS